MAQSSFSIIVPVLFTRELGTSPTCAEIPKSALERLGRRLVATDQAEAGDIELELCLCSAGIYDPTAT